MATWQDELGELMVTRGRALVRYAFMLCGDRALAEDLVQDALVKVFSRLRGPGRTPGTAAGAVVHDLEAAGVTSAEAYVRRAILTLYLDGYRRRQRFAGIRHLLPDAGPSPSPEGVASARTDVTAALGRLGPRLRACAVLRYYEDLTVPQIADTLGIAEGTVKRYLSEATTSLQKSLQSEGRTAP
ncbi:sigma-70 family RNA polymerase sigma factor [Antribacter sp. KLBMP9083]|uniref:Sigma-70 family RNA polymerase sigma factor n=1 Tax=Antribacter soli TaxID=2910976 RepID=A0AA41U5P9_9MICO|nr:sigma-70 family RNA polymerase sigma factor [Antribacter soli]MCF4119581.1 sigma-70 family RNA polymerase sigma factor [Antribacter soli]